MEKIKPIINWIESEKGKDILIVVIVILVGLGSFELGRLSKESAQGGVKIEYSGQNSGQEANVARATINTQNTQSDIGLPAQVGKNFFASNKGTKYYSLGCSGGKTIKQENRIYFASGEEAEQAGYVLSTSCK